MLDSGNISIMCLPYMSFSENPSKDFLLTAYSRLRLLFFLVGLSSLPDPKRYTCVQAHLLYRLRFSIGHIHGTFRKQKNTINNESARPFSPSTYIAEQLVNATQIDGAPPPLWILESLTQSHVFVVISSLSYNLVKKKLLKTAGT